jgi:RNA polymerase sigma factor (sigma-70 family)
VQEESHLHRTVVELYRARFDRLAAEAERLVGRRAVAEDLVQEAFLRLLGDPPHDEARTLAWLRVVIRRLAVDWLRDERRTGADTGQDVRLSPSAEETALRGLEREALETALASLPDRDRRALWLRHSGHSYREIGAALGIPDNQVGVVLLRSLQKLRSAMPPAGDFGSREKGNSHA